MPEPKSGALPLGDTPVVTENQYTKLIDIFLAELALETQIAYHNDMHKHLRAKGFTLIELLVVISIIVILTALTIVVYDNVLKQSHDGKRQSDMTALSHALETYYQKNGEYPAGCMLVNPCKTYVKNDTSGSLNNDPGSFTPGNSVQINASITSSQLKTLLPGLDSSFGDPSNNSSTQLFLNNQTSGLPQQYIYIGGLVNTTSQTSDYTVDFNGSGNNTNPVSCQIWATLAPNAVSSYIIGYHSEVDNYWHLRQGNHGTKFIGGPAQNPKTGQTDPNYIFCWGGKANVMWAN